MAVEVFNLAPPPNFRGLDPYKPITVYYRHLPHWRQEGASYFVTFRLGDALPREKVDYLKRLRDDWERRQPPPRTKEAWDAHVRDMFQQEETWLDAGYGACHLRNPGRAATLEEALRHFQDERYFVGCWVIMPNHCHLVIRPFDNWPLETILQGIKGVVARRINLLIAGSGSLWQEESYDRIIRDE
jgi:hypothetical protein